MAVVSTPYHRDPVRALHRLIGRIWAWNDARVTRNTLARLSDRELDDLGLCRGDIDDIANGTGRF